MAYDPDARPRTITVPGEGAQTLSFTLPPGVILKLESILATINGGAGTPTPELVIEAPGGAVIAAKRQGLAVEAGAGNRATWALRLDDEAESSTNGGMTIALGQFWRSTVQSVPSGVDTPIQYDNFATTDASVFAWSNATPERAKFLVAGYYLCFPVANFAAIPAGTVVRTTPALFTDPGGVNLGVGGSPLGNQAWDSLNNTSAWTRVVHGYNLAAASTPPWWYRQSVFQNSAGALNAQSARLIVLYFGMSITGGLV